MLEDLTRGVRSVGGFLGAIGSTGNKLGRGKSSATGGIEGAFGGLAGLVTSAFGITEGAALGSLREKLAENRLARASLTGGMLGRLQNRYSHSSGDSIQEDVARETLLHDPEVLQILDDRRAGETFWSRIGVADPHFTDAQIASAAILAKNRAEGVSPKETGNYAQQLKLNSKLFFSTGNPTLEALDDAFKREIENNFPGLFWRTESGQLYSKEGNRLCSDKDLGGMLEQYIGRKSKTASVGTSREHAAAAVAATVPPEARHPGITDPVVADSGFKRPTSSPSTYSEGAEVARHDA